MTSAARCLTVVVHGTFAAKERWWRPRREGSPTFADDLEEALAKRGMDGTVWAPASAAGVRPRMFSWSGRNAHGARLRGAVNLAARLREAASGLGATAADPLVVHFVAHSHGGNVVLEALEDLGPTVRCGQVVMMGTPLIQRTPVLRPARLLVALALLSTLVIFGLALALLLAAALGGESDAAWDFAISASLVLLVIFPLSGWFARLAAWGIDGAWRILSGPFRLLVGRRGGACYGPAPRRLGAILGDRKILLITSAFDEAVLSLELGATPQVVYEYISRNHGPLRRAGEWFFLKPGIHFALDFVEAVLERWILGFSWRQVLFFDHHAGEETRCGSYPEALVECVDMTEALKSAGRTRGLSTGPITLRIRPDIETEDLEAGERRFILLRKRLNEIRRSFESQIRLRHSLYYQCPEVVDRVADRIAGTAEFVEHAPMEEERP